MSLLRRIEKQMDARLRGIFSAGSEEPGAREAIEMYRDALEQVRSRVIRGNRGERIFPFNLISIDLALAAANPERKAVLEAMFEPGQLIEDIRATLREERCEAPGDLTVSIHFPAEPTADVTVRCEKTEKTQAAPSATIPTVQLIPAQLVILKGEASAAPFELTKPNINLGREAEVVDALGRPIRRNDLFFPEQAHEANSSVSRAHAHIRFDSHSGEWRIYDDGSSIGTSLFREGRRIDVPAHAARGVALRAGDEIYLGQVRLRFEIYIMDAA